MSLSSVHLESERLFQSTIVQHAGETERQLASLAGDLRGPLRALEDCSQALRRQHGNRLNEEGRRMLAAVSEELGRTSRLLDGLLTYTSLSNQPMACARVDMTALVESVHQTLSRISPHEALEFRLDTLPPATGDESMLRHVFFNLLSNALKFTRNQPRPLIHVRGLQRGAWCEYSIQDNGIGFDSPQAARLFSPFQRLHDGADHPGAGLGLAIVERIVRRHGGRVWAESLPGQGAKFSFTLTPGAKSSNAAAPAMSGG